MPPPPRLLLPASRGALVRYWITRTFSGRAIAAGAVIKLVAFALVLVFGRSAPLEFIDTLGDLSLLAGALVLAFRLFVDMKLRLLWRVRSKLTVSYIFIGLVPALLIIVFFFVAGLLLFFNFATYMMTKEMAQLVDETRFVAQSTALAIQRAQGPAEVRDILEAARVTILASQYPGASLAIVPTDRRCGAGSTSFAVGEIAVGPWKHLSVPRAVPGWILCSGYSGLMTYIDAERPRVVARTALWPDGFDDAVIVDVPLDEVFASELRKRTGVSFGDVAIAVLRDDAEPEIKLPPEARKGVRLGTANIDVGNGASGGLRWVAPFDYRDWDSGDAANVVVSFGMALRDIYDRINVSAGSVGKVDFGQYLVIMLAIVGCLFLIIQIVAFSMGLALARSITGSVHELFAGTERVRHGNFAGRVAIRSRDQLGDLAESFNSMTASIEDLLQQKAEKERLEQELRIARNIQMSLLPQGPLAMPGITLTAHCEPAREVGGDYYDFLPIDDHTFGILIADVSGKGTSAALYMAELKGIVLSLSQRHRSPRALLIEADRIISRHLDSRSFITVSYLVIDLLEATLKYARAGHCPLVYVPGPYAASRTPQLMVPDGLVLGLQLDEGRTFVRLLEEVTVPLGRGDLFVLYTDGLSEAMNANGDCFGDLRLASLVAQHADIGADELRERVLREIDAYTGSAAQQDDMTMVLLRVEQVLQPVAQPFAAHAGA